MNKDFKIGLIIGLAVFIAGIVYFVVFDSSAPKPQPAAPAGNEVEMAETEVAISDTELSPSDFPPPPAATPAAAPAPAASVESSVNEWESSRGTPAATTEIPEPTRPDPSKPAAVVETIEVTTADSNTIVPAPAAPAATAPDDFSLPEVAPAPRETVAVETVTPVAPAAVTPSSYTVKAGDVGWVIAEKVYGQGMGRYWRNIAKANPSVDFSNIRPGLVLIIPELPADVTQRMENRKRAGETITDSSGRKVYIVSKEDTKGLWGISVKFYGKGQYWPKIAKANPGVNPDQLRPGTKLIIPDIAESGTRAYDILSDSTPGGETVTPVDITRNYYTVKSGDSMWTIAQKEYGDGKYADLIKNANPGIDPNNLRVGFKLVIPAKPAGAESAAPASTSPERPAATPRRSEPARPVPSDEPDFGP